MNCEIFNRLLDEIPMPRWSSQQQSLAGAHCKHCPSCEKLLQHEQQLFSRYEELKVVEPNCEFVVPRQTDAAISKPAIAGLISNLALALIVLGAGSQFIIAGGSFFGLQGFSDRLSFAWSQIANAPALGVVLVFAAVVYCLAASTTSRISYNNHSD